ncbi:hypothetical protein JAAARDRAFT_35817 [Jaapia argillacea MUCL 33604]|uniref:Alpha-methylacyl-CoA racemase n=1 Tax=Jaapia argillacea MUCL 33604 TaxID=933084 RepID=A0A067PTN8_9AGAM|nr:hypothetical protein JAAARDRAFT_35817 [Jaapia argillacea MUCL 33604]
MPVSPLTGLRAIEFAGLAPGPLAGLVLADWGATVIRIDKPDQPTSLDVLCRGKRSLAINPKVPSGLAIVKKLVSDADVLIDPFRPGVLEKLGLGPDVFLGKGGLNHRLVYARLAGFSRTGPHKDMAGHDINYVALSGVLSMLPGSPEKPTFPLNLLGDFAGGGLMCALGILLALFERNKSGLGQVVNTDMVSGTRYVSAFPLVNSLYQTPYFSGARTTNLLDGGSPFYDIYTCSDGKWMSVGCLEPQFFAVFIKHFKNALPKDFSVGNGWVPSAEIQDDKATWPQMKEYFTKGFKTNTRDYWGKVFHGTDACTVPILSPEEAASLDGHTNSALPHPHPELTRTPPVENASSDVVLQPGQHTNEVLKESGLSEAEIQKLVLDGALGMKLKASLAASSKL